MLQITIKQDETTSVQLFNTDERAQKFLEHLQKGHVKRFGLQKIESLKKQHYNKNQNCLNDDYRNRIRAECAEKVKWGLGRLLTKPSLLKVDIKHIDNLL